MDDTVFQGRDFFAGEGTPRLLQHSFAVGARNHLGPEIGIRTVVLRGVSCDGNATRAMICLGRHPVPDRNGVNIVGKILKEFFLTIFKGHIL